MILDVVNQYDTPENPLSAQDRAQAILTVAQAGTSDRERIKQKASAMFALNKELTGDSDGAWGTAKSIAAEGLPTVGYGMTFAAGAILGGGVGGLVGLTGTAAGAATVAGQVAVGAGTSGYNKTTGLLEATTDADTGEVKEHGMDYDEAALRGYGYGTAEAVTEIATGHVLGLGFKVLNKATGGIVGKAGSKALDAGARQMSKSKLGIGIAALWKGTRRITSMSALDNPLTEYIEEVPLQQWDERVFASKASENETQTYTKNIFNEATGQIESVPIEVGSDEEEEAREQYGLSGDKSGYAEAGMRKMGIGEITADFNKKAYTWEQTAAFARGFALQYMLNIGGGAMQTMSTKESREFIDQSLFAAKTSRASLIRMTDEQKLGAFNAFYGDKGNQEKFAKLFKDSGELLNQTAQRLQESNQWKEEGAKTKPTFDKAAAAKIMGEEDGATSFDDDASGLSITMETNEENKSVYTVIDRDEFLQPRSYPT
jgi:hypothetical protein